MTGIYKIQSKKKPNRIYIGSAVNIFNRWREHLKKLRRNVHHSRKLQNHFNKYGEGDISFSKLVSCEKDDLLDHEQYFIDVYNPWFNICPNAKNSLGVKRTDEYKKKISKSAKGRVSGMKGKHHTEETKQKIREKNKNHKQTEESNKKRSIALKGRKHSEEEIRRMSESRRGLKMSEESKQNLRIKLKGNKNAYGHVLSDCVKRKMAESKRGNKNMLGKHHSQEARKKMSESRKGKPSSMKGKTHSEEARKKLRIALRGNKNRLGHFHTEETKLKISNTKKHKKKALYYEKADIG